MKTREFGTRIGILGGGQLARMLALAAHPMGYEPVILSERPTDPAAQVVRHWIQGDPKKPADQMKLLKAVDVATFESEFISGKELAQSSKKARVPIFPKPSCMHLLRDRLSQKKLLIKYKVPTAAFDFVKTSKTLSKVLSSRPNGVVFKTRTGGYDGYGTFIYDGKGPLPDLPSQKLESFIIEEKLKFKRELAISFARNKKGQIVRFPWVESHQTDARCDWVMGPLSSALLDDFAERLENFVEGIKYVGVIAFEVFDTGQELLVNEIAPRVHNSAHYSQNALSESQFDLHIKAIAGEELKSPKLLSPGFAMANLLGTRTDSPRVPKDLQAHLHWYGKEDNRPGRKMGHLNSLGKKPKEALDNALNERRKVKL